MKIVSSVFQNQEHIPIRYTCDGKNAFPLLEWSEVLAGNSSLVLIMDDPDVPHGTWNHWIILKTP